MKRFNAVSFLLNCFQLAVDFAAAFSGFLLAIWFYKTNWLQSYKLHPHEPEFSTYLYIALAFAVLTVINFAWKSLYQSRETGLMNMDEATRVMQSLFIVSLVVTAVIGFAQWNYLLQYRDVNSKISQVVGASVLKQLEYVSRLVLTLGIFFSCMLVLVGRALGYKVRRYLQRRGHFYRRVILCGAGEAGRTIARKLLQSPKFHILPVAFLDDDPEKSGNSIVCLNDHKPLPVAGATGDLDQTIQKFQASEIWITMPGAEQGVIETILRSAERNNVDCRFVPNLFRIPMDRLTVDTVGGLPLLAIKPSTAVRRIPVTKRVFDVAFSLAVLVLSLPLWPIFMLLVRLSSKGPIFFVQKRIGRGGKEFHMYKFRTMFVDAPTYASAPSRKNDPRITPIGRWFRRMSVDELPQFWNVLKGDMSVVGPRPEMPHIVDEYSDLQRRRLAVKPGITGLWQISIDRKDPIHENLDYDLYYIENQSFFMDLMIVLTTGIYGARGV